MSGAVELTDLVNRMRRVIPLAPFAYRGKVFSPEEQLRDVAMAADKIFIPTDVDSDFIDFISAPNNDRNTHVPALSIFSLAVVANNKFQARKWSKHAGFNKQAFANQVALLACPTKEVYDTLISCGIEFSPEVIALAITRTSEYELAQPLLNSLGRFEKPQGIKEYEPFYPIDAGLCQLWIDAGYIPTADELVLYNSSALTQALNNFPGLATETDSQGSNLLHKVCQFYDGQTDASDYCYVDDDEYSRILSVCLRYGCMADMPNSFGETAWSFTERTYPCLLGTGFFDEYEILPPIPISKRWD